ncbi:MAG: LamG-like jellyroll fold domain-containing protein, partial [Caldilineaceae bacterium]
TQAYPGAYVAQVADGLEIGVPAQPQFFYQDVPNFAGTPVGDNPQFGWTSVLFQSAAKVYQNANYGGAAQIFDPFAGITSLKAQWPSWVSSMRIWPAQHAAQAGSIAYADTASTFDGPIYALEGAISDHTADSIDIYFEGQTATSDPDGVENWALDNVQVTLERDETSIPLNNQSFTLAAWAKRSATGNWDPIITQGPNGTDQHLYFGFRGDQPNVFTCAFSKVGNALKSPSAYTDLDWHHWVCTYDVATNTRILYRDGVEIASDTAAGSHSGLGTTYIGRNVTTETFHGQIDEIGVWRQPLTAADVAALYNKVKAEDQSVMVGTLFAVDGSTTVAGSEVVLRETATNVGAVQQTTARTLTVDPDNPTVCPDASQCPLNGQYVQNRGTLIMAGTAQDPTSYIERVEVDNGGWQTLTGTAAWSYAWDMSAQADGEHTLPVRATDAVGNVSPVYAINVIVDSTPPQPAFTTGTADAQRPAQDAQGNWSVTLAGTVSDPNAGSQPRQRCHRRPVLLDGSGAVAGQGWQPAALSGGNWTIDYVLPSLDDSGSSQIDPSGVYTVSVRAADAVGNLTRPDAYLTRQLRLDAEAPDVTLTASVSGMQLITTALTLSGDVSDVSAISAVEVNLTPAEQMDALGGAVLHLPFDERRPTGFFADESGAGQPATCTATCPAVNEPGRRDRAAGFNGTSQYLTLPALFDPAETAFTVAVWFNAATLGQGPMVQQRDGTKVGRAWLYTGADGTIQTYLGGSALATTGKVATGEWHHAAVSYDGAHLAIYLDGALETRVARTMESSDGAMLIGVGKNLNSFFSGQLDELVIYDRALADYEITDLYGYGQGVWASATVDGGGWRFTIPDGADGVEGYFQINGRGIDALGNVTPQSEQRFWRGEIDTKPPLVSSLVNEDGSGGVTTTTYTCTATDFNLDAASSCVATGEIPFFRAGDITLTTYDQVDPWFAATITDTSRLYGMDAARVYSATAVSGMSMQACDIYDAAPPSNPISQSRSASGTVGAAVGPSAGTVLTTLDP